MSESSELHYRRPDTPYRVLSTIAKTGELSIFTLGAVVTLLGEPLAGSASMAIAVITAAANSYLDFKASRVIVKPFAVQTGQFDDIREAGEGGADIVVSGDAPRGKHGIPTVQLLRRRDLPSEQDPEDKK